MMDYDSMDERRRRLLEAMRGQRGGAVMGRHGGLGQRRGAGDMAPMGVPGLTFNPFMAQLARGVQGLHGPSRINTPQAPMQYPGAPQSVGMSPAAAPNPQTPAYDPFAGREGGRQFMGGVTAPPTGFYGSAQSPPEPLLGMRRKPLLMPEGF